MNMQSVTNIVSTYMENRTLQTYLNKKDRTKELMYLKNDL